jgi:hypothetical protein
MVITPEQWFTFALAAFGGTFGALFGGYFRRKGEDLATHEDIAKLVDQVKATTAATESIRADITGRLWVTQERWKQKTELYVTALTLLDNFARGWERLVTGQSQASEVPSYENDIQKVMVMAQIVNPGLISVLAPLTAKRTPQPGAEHIEFTRAEGALHRRVYMSIAEEARRDLGFDGLDR